MILLLLAFALAALFSYFFWINHQVKKRRLNFFNRPFSPSETNILRQNTLYQKIASTHSDALKNLHGHINVFLSEKKIRNKYDGKAVTKEKQLLVALEACFPLINRETNYYALITEVDIDYNEQTSLGGPKTFYPTGERLNWFHILFKTFQEEIKVFPKEVNSESFYTLSLQFFVEPEVIKTTNPEIFSLLKNFYKIDLSE